MWTYHEERFQDIVSIFLNSQLYARADFTGYTDEITRLKEMILWMFSMTEQIIDEHPTNAAEFIQEVTSPFVISTSNRL